MNLDQFLAAKLAELDSAQLRRSLLLPKNGPGLLLNFASNDYLGLGSHPALVEASHEATARLGTGAGASRLLGGSGSEAILALETILAHWKQKEAALVFSSGYSAALGTIPALVGPGDTIILDKLAHASLIDAARLSGATIRIFPHNRTDRLGAILQASASKEGHRLIVTESIFSMDGDAAPLREIVEIKERHDACLLVDEAHATGLYGPDGAGLIAELGLSSQVDIILATQSKALGSVGGVIAGSRLLIDWLVNRARSFIYSTALPPGAIAASHAAVDLLRGPEGATLRARLQDHIGHFRAGLPPHWVSRAPGTGAIQPLLCGESSDALRLARVLRDAGFFIPAIRYPTVPRRTARLRVTLNATHTDADIDWLLNILRKLN